MEPRCDSACNKSSRKDPPYKGVDLVKHIYPAVSPQKMFQHQTGRLHILCGVEVYLLFILLPRIHSRTFATLPRDQQDQKFHQVSISRPAVLKIMEHEKPRDRTCEQDEVRGWIIQASYLPDRVGLMARALAVGNKGEGQVGEPSSNVLPDSA